MWHTWIKALPAEIGPGHHRPGHGPLQGFGFVEMRYDQEAQEAIQVLDAKDFNGRPLTVNVAKPREDRSGGQRSFADSRDRGGSSGGKRR